MFDMYKKVPYIRDFLNVMGKELKRYEECSNLLSKQSPDQKLTGNSLNRNMQFDVSHAWENPTLASATYINLDNAYGDWNKPCVIQSNTADAPPDMAWGIREVLYIGGQAVILRVTGVKTDGGTMCIWVRAYNTGNWTAWREC